MFGYTTLYIVNGSVYRNGYDANKRIQYLATNGIDITLTRRQVQVDTNKHNCFMTLVEWFKF